MRHRHLQNYWSRYGLSKLQRNRSYQILSASTTRKTSYKRPILEVPILSKNGSETSSKKFRTLNTKVGAAAEQAMQSRGVSTLFRRIQLGNHLPRFMGTPLLPTIRSQYCGRMRRTIGKFLQIGLRRSTSFSATRYLAP